jgi:hypothetical protein
LRRIILRFAIAVLAFLLAGVGFFVTLAFAMVGIYFLFAQFLGPVWGAFATGGTALLAAVILIFIGVSFSRVSRRRGKKDGTDPSFLAAMMGDLLGRRFNKFAGSRTRSSIFASFAAGFAIGASPRLREFLLDLVRS